MNDSSSSPPDCQPAGVIYKITNTLNGKLYVGQTRQKFSRRINGHKSSNIKNGVDGAIKKYGWENFTAEVIEECPVDQLNEREIFWIAELKCKAPNGYNLTDGGDGGLNPSEETRTKMSAAKKGKPPHNRGKFSSDETRARISANHADCSGEKNSFYGKRHTKETCSKMSAAKKGKSHKPHSPETKAKIGAANKGKKRSPETCARIKAAWVRRRKKAIENGSNK